MRWGQLSVLIGLGLAGGCGTATSPSGAEGDGYAHVQPPSFDPSPSLQPETWIDHLTDDLLPFWTQAAARGEPTGNFPTFRTMTGVVTGSTERRPRMLSRQTYAYAIGYTLTGDPELLRLARAGVDWLLEHGPDREQGGYHALLDADGQAAGNYDKMAQDTAYVMLGLAAYYFVTRDPRVEAELLAGRDLLFDADTYWDVENRRIRDGMRADFSAPVDQFSDGGWELVAQLDPINAFLLLVQPLLTEPSRRAQFLDDLRILSETMVDQFFDGDVYWGISNQIGRYGTRHVDFGHTLKAHWMVLQVDKRLPQHPFREFVAEQAPAMLERSFDSGRWSKRPTSDTAVESGSDWWIYAESDQIAATLTMAGVDLVEELEATSRNWLVDFVDTDRGGEVIPGIRGDGAPVYGWPDTDTAKCNQWKNGYHSVEHALVMYLVTSYLNDAPAELHFALPAESAASAPLVPYFFQAELAERTLLDPIEVGGAPLTVVRARFVDLY
jgi:hypothetical protein